MVALLSEFAMSNAAGMFRPMPGHNPRTRQDRYKRVHYYVAQLGTAASAQLKQALLVLRNAAQQLPTEELRGIAGKQYIETEFLPATKELLCMWIHLEAVDQGGEMMPSWLMNYLKLALYATDYLIAEPQAVSVMEQHAACDDLPELMLEVSVSLASHLGFGAAAPALGPALAPLLQNSRPVRQKILKDSLTLEIAESEAAI